MANVRRKKPVDQMKAYRQVHAVVEVPSENFITIPDMLIWVLGASAIFIVVTIGRGVFNFFVETTEYLPTLSAESAVMEPQGEILVETTPANSEIGQAATRAATGLNQTITGLQNRFTKTVGLRKQKDEPVGNAFKR